MNRYFLLIIKNFNAFSSHFFKPELPYSFWITITLAMGIILAHNVSFLTYKLILFLAGISLFFLTKTKKQVDSQKAFLLFGSFTLGIGTYTYQHLKKPPFVSLHNTCITAHVIDKAFLNGKEWSHRLLVKVTEIKQEDTTSKTDFLLYVYCRKHSYCWVDDTIITGPLNLVVPQNNDFSFYLHKEGISATTFCDKLEIIDQIRPEKSMRNWLFWQRELLQIRLRKKMSPQAFAFFSSLFMGNKQSVASHLENHKIKFKIWGISHHLARSGLHLLIFLLILNTILSCIPLNFFLKQLLLFGTITIYTLFSWTSISFIRALGIYGLYTVGLIFHRKNHALHIFSLFCFFILLINPLQLFALDFQLSFLLSFCLLWVAHLNHQKQVSLLKKLALNNY